MFSIPNPKKTITVDYTVVQLMNAIPKIYISSNGKYKITKTNDIFKQIT